MSTGNSPQYGVGQYGTSQYGTGNALDSNEGASIFLRHQVNVVMPSELIYNAPVDVVPKTVFKAAL